QAPASDGRAGSDRVLAGQDEGHQDQRGLLRRDEAVRHTRAAAEAAAMQWWAWIAVGAILLGSELAFVDAQFYLVFVGAAALVVGFLDLAGLFIGLSLQWIIFAMLAVCVMIGFRRRIYERMRRNLPIMRSGPAGGVVTLP